MNRIALKEISKSISSGLTPLRSNSKFWEGGNIPWVKTEQLGNKYIYDSNEKITDYALNNTTIKLNPSNTLSIAMYGEGKTRGSVSILRTETTTNQACCNLSIDEEKAYYEYVYYFLKTQYENLRNLSSGVRKNLNSNDIKNFEISLPESIKTQKQIAKVLSDLDAKIEVNNKINQELEKMAKTIYDYWFVQFDFPDPNGKPYKSSGGKMVYNQELKCEIPEGWEVSTISDWIENGKNGDWGKEEEQGNYTEKVSCIRGADINGLNGKGEVKSPTRYILEKNNHKILEVGDLIIEISGGSPTQSTGRLAFITKETLDRFENPLICSNFCKAVTLKDKMYLYNFVYKWNRMYDAGVLFGWEGKTSGIKNLLFENFITNFKVVKSPKEIVEQFYNKVKTIHQKKQKNLLENQKLAALRDWLLPMLMNGQVTVGEAKEELRMVAEPGTIYEKDKVSLDNLYNSVNYDYEVATVVLLTRQILNRTFGKKYIHKMFSNIQFFESLPVFEDLEFQENGWGMYCPILTKTIENKRFIIFEDINDDMSVINFNYKHIKEVANWINAEENQEFVSQVKHMLNIYQKSLINKDMNRIELLNTVLECMNVLETDSFDAIYTKMENWEMREEGYQNKAEKFNPEETRLMIDFIKEIQ